MKRILCMWDRVFSEPSAKVNFSDNLKHLTTLLLPNTLSSMSTLMPSYYSNSGDAVYD